jgi:hypothetical protein
MKTRPHCAVCALVLNLLSQVGNLALRFCLTLESYYSPARNVIPDTHSVGSELVGASQAQQMTQLHPSTKSVGCQMNVARLALLPLALVGLLLLPQRPTKIAGRSQPQCAEQQQKQRVVSRVSDRH